jgi:2-oxo-4-hydroxy-4-carboxy-5-ureidoimidazoline decarboxylase
MTLDQFNALSTDEAMKDLIKCCGARRWAEQVAARRPYRSKESLLEMADDVWGKMERDDILEAFTHHPKIGDVDSLRKKFASTAQWASGEQSGVAGAAEKTLRDLADGNTAYEKKFGHIFIVCATGKNAGEMLEILRGRLGNDPARELTIAAGEQQKITRIRLVKLLAA